MLSFGVYLTRASLVLPSDCSTKRRMASPRDGKSFCFRRQASTPSIMLVSSCISKRSVLGDISVGYVRYSVLCVTFAGRGKRWICLARSRDIREPLSKWYAAVAACARTQNAMVRRYGKGTRFWNTGARTGEFPLMRRCQIPRPEHSERSWAQAGRGDSNAP
jgi:hypothetical protein